MPTVSQATQHLMGRYQQWQKSLEPPSQGVATVHVDEVAARVAAFYEKIRGVIDWREEHLLRRGAIERILKRRFLLGQSGKDIAAPFVAELIRGGYFPNDKIEESKIEQVQKLTDKYLFILKNAPALSDEKAKLQLYDWLISLAACETEETLEFGQRERALIEYMETLMRQKISAPSGMLEEEKNIQIAIAVQKALFKLDKAVISYHLLKIRYLDWRNLSSAQIENITKNIYSIWEGIERDLNHPLREKFYRVCERYDTPYLILGDVISKNPSQFSETINKPEVLEGSIRESYKQRLKKLKSRIARAAAYSTISIFTTKILLALAIEVPFEKYVTGSFDFRSMGLNVLIPPLMMLFIVLSIRPPRKSNLEKVVIETMKIIFQTEKRESYAVKAPKPRGLAINLLVGFFYIAISLVSFGIIWFGLSELKFSLISKIIFVVFFSLISFAGVKIRERSKELSVEEEKDGLFASLLDSFSLPFLQLGKWLSSQWAKYNTVIVVLTALIDMPLQLFTEFLEQWRFFLKEKKDEIH